MTPSQLKTLYQRYNPDGHFFDWKTMRYFGDTMRNYGVRSAGNNWELYRKHPVKHRLNGSAYFNKVTFKQDHSPEMKGQ